MPANLTPEYFKAEKWFREAATPEEKILALEQMLRVIPKHKGTDHLRADLRRKLSKLKEVGAKKVGAKHVDIFHIPRSGAGQIALLGTPKRAKWLLKRFHNMTSESGRIIAQTRDPYQTDLPEHLTYHQRNREQGKMAGQAQIRVRYKKYVTPWIDFLMLSQAEMLASLEGTGWQVKDLIDGQGGTYVAIIEKLT